jgi:glucosyltransferase
MDLISIVIPCYNEEKALPLFYSEISRVLQNMTEEFGVDFEMIFADDGSKDNTLAILKEYRKSDTRVRYISFSRNFGKEAAIIAGLRKSAGDFVALMDADLQDPPILLADMYRELADKSKKIDCVATRRVTRKGEPKIRSFFARMFYRLMRKISDTEIVDGAKDYRMMTRKMVDSILSMNEYNRFSKGIFSWVGFDTHWLEYENVERVAGETKWSFFKLFAYSIEGIVAFSTAPLSIASFTGIFFCILSFLLILVVVVRALIWGDPVAGWPSTVCIILFIGGIQLFCIGILGQYLAKTFLETKNRPLYIIRESENDIV